MSLELLKSIEAAEVKAVEMRAEAQKEARDILKSVEEACIADERSAALEHRALGQRILEDARATANRRSDAQAGKEAAERDAVAKAAQARLDQAAQVIFERIVRDGHR